MQKKTLIILSLIIILLVPVIVACSGGGQAQKEKPEPVATEPAAIPEPVSFTIGMAEYSYEPDTIQVKVGQEVTLKLVNNGVLAHELMIGRDVAKKDGHPNGYSVDLFESTNVEPMIMAGAVDGAMDMDMGEEVEGDTEHKDDESMADGHMGTMVTVENSGDKASITFVVTEDMVGEWEMGCFKLDGVHYDSGMKGTFIVTQ